VGQAGLAGAHPRPATDERLGRHRVVRRAERASARQQRPLPQAGDRVDSADLCRLAFVERRLDARRGPGEQGLADAGRSAEREVVPAGDGNLEGPTSDDLSHDRGEVGRVDGISGPGRGSFRPRSRDALDARQVTDDLADASRRVDADVPRRGALSGVLPRHHDGPCAGGPRGRDERQHARHRPHGSVQRELADERRARQLPPVHLIGGDENRDRDGQVVAGPLLRQIGRGEVHRDPAGGHLEA
jgi:hypothetical protein